MSSHPLLVVISRQIFFHQKVKKDMPSMNLIKIIDSIQNATSLITDFPQTLIDEDHHVVLLSLRYKIQKKKL